MCRDLQNSCRVTPMSRSAFLRLTISLILLLSMPSMVMSDTTVQPNTKYILVTGFEPFGNESTNGSWEAIQHLQGGVMANKKVIVYQLPVVWEKASEILQGLILKYRP